MKSYLEFSQFHRQFNFVYAGGLDYEIKYWTRFLNFYIRKIKKYKKRDFRVTLFIFRSRQCLYSNFIQKNCNFVYLDDLGIPEFYGNGMYYHDIWNHRQVIRKVIYYIKIDMLTFRFNLIQPDDILHEFFQKGEHWSRPKIQLNLLRILDNPPFIALNFNNINDKVIQLRDEIESYTRLKTYIICNPEQAYISNYPDLPILYFNDNVYLKCISLILYWSLIHIGEPNGFSVLANYINCPSLLISDNYTDLQFFSNNFNPRKAYVECLESSLETIDTCDLLKRLELMISDIRIGTRYQKFQSWEMTAAYSGKTINTDFLDRLYLFSRQNALPF